MVKNSPPAKEGWLRAKRADGVVCVFIRFKRIHKNRPALWAPLLQEGGEFLHVFALFHKQLSVLFEQPLIHELPLLFLKDR